MLHGQFQTCLGEKPSLLDVIRVFRPPAVHLDCHDPGQRQQADDDRRAEHDQISTPRRG